jgi:putative hydrolase of the HAD superfamily
MGARTPVDPRGVRALLFDLGGVVIEIDFDRAIRYWADRAPCAPALLRPRFVLDADYEQHERGELSSSAYFGRLRRTLGVDLTDQELVHGWNDVFLGPMPGMDALLAAAGRRYPLFAFTNSNPTHQRVWRERFAAGLRPFHQVFVSSELGLRKPDPGAFRVVAGRAGFAPAEMLFFDDSPANVEGARHAGMPAVLVESPDDVRQALEGLGGLDLIDPVPPRR